MAGIGERSGRAERLLLGQVVSGSGRFGRLYDSHQGASCEMDLSVGACLHEDRAQIVAGGPTSRTQQF